MKNKDKIIIVLAIFIIFAILSWIVPSGIYNITEQGVAFESTISRISILEILYLIPFAINYIANDLIYLFIIGGLYGVLSKAKAYRKLVSNTVKLINGREHFAMLAVTLLMGIYISISNNIMSLLWIVPFIITVFLKRGKDRLTAISAGFGGIFIGTIGLTFGTFGVDMLNSQFGLSVTDGMVYKVILFVAAYALFNLFAILHMNKQEKVVNEVKYDVFATTKLSEEESKKRTLVWPTVFILSLGLIFALIGYINWSGSFNVEIFNKFHTELNTVYVGELPIFKSLLSGESMYPIAGFGTWVDMLPLAFVLLIVSFIVAMVNKMSFSEYIDNFSKGILSFNKVVFIYIMLIAILVVCGVFTWPLTILDKVLPDNFNLFVLAIFAILVALFYCQQSISSTLLVPMLATRFSNDLLMTGVIVHFGFAFVQVIAPTSLILMMALTYLDVPYKSWLSYIWKFALSILGIFLLVMAIGCYM